MPVANTSYDVIILPYCRGDCRQGTSHAKGLVYKCQFLAQKGVVICPRGGVVKAIFGGGAGNGLAVKKREVAIIVTGMVTAGLMLTGCGVSSPTYGTDKSTGKQLVDDFSNITSNRSNNNRNQIDTKPRPELVRPAPGTKGVLPQPQTNVAQTGTPDWPESPEQKRQRLRDEATANQNNPNYVSPIVPDSGKETKSTGSSDWLNGIHRNEQVNNDKEQRAEFLRRKRETQGGSSTTRKYLSEPPLSYRQPAASAPIGDQGEDEAKKERERKKALKESSGKKSWWPF